jgi:aquaporin Z
MKAPWQKYLAEFFGTFVLVFGGSAAIIGLFKLTGGQGSPELTLLTAPFAFGLALLAGLYAFGETSGGHFNPAVSLALFLDRRLGVVDLIGYWIFQFAGAILASGVMLATFDKAAVKATTTVPSFGKGPAVVFEIVFTAIFVLTIVQVTKSGTFGAGALVAIPLALVMIHFAAILVSGASVNPARTLGPAVISNTWTDIWIYFLCPAAGAILGWLVHSVVVEGDIRDDASYVKDEVSSEMHGGGRAVSDDVPDPAAPSWGTHTEEESKEE